MYNLQLAQRIHIQEQTCTIVLEKEVYAEFKGEASKELENLTMGNAIKFNGLVPGKYATVDLKWFAFPHFLFFSNITGEVSKRRGNVALSCSLFSSKYRESKKNTVNFAP